MVHAARADAEVRLMPAHEYSDRTRGLTNEPPLLNGTSYESEDGDVVQFLVTVRGNAIAGALTPMGRIRKAIIAVAKEHDLDVAVAGHPRYAPAMKAKRG
jgi:hypothetical protein